MLLAAPLAPLATGIAAEWLDFRALRYPILLLMFTGVTATAIALTQSPSRTTLVALRALALGVLAWAAAETVYVIIHAARGTPFDAERFGPQWAQALGLIGVHALALGAPTGVVAALMLLLRERWLARV